jgi:ribulose 1,5-bisphosphate synthetase/thiazole synthase
VQEATRRSFLKVSAGAVGAAALEASAQPVPDLTRSVGSNGAYAYTRSLPVEEGYDLVVAGGGPAGASAAICAARFGAKVLLVEATGCLGGMGTSGLVTAFDPMADGERMLVGGLMREIMAKLGVRGFLAPQVTEAYYTRRYLCWTPFRVEGYKLVLDELSAEAGVEIRYFTRVVDADVASGAKRLNGVVLQNVDGLRFVRAKTFIDATGDAVLSKACGVPCREAGRDTPGIMPPTLCAQLANIDWKRTSSVNQQALVEKALKEGFFSQKDHHVPGLFRVGESTGMLNAGHLFHMNALQCRSLSEGMARGRRLVQEYLAFYRKYVPGCENAELMATGSLMGVRESRRIVGEYELNYADYCSKRQFPDQIGVYNAPVDIHVYDDSESEYARYSEEYTKTGRLKAGECFGLPYGILVPRGWSNLWVAGRCNSSDVRVSGCIRVQPAAAMMGQAAGTAAVQSIARGQAACDLDTAALVETLRKAGAYLPQPMPPSEMTRTKA